jgi:hypothetical protein
MALTKYSYPNRYCFVGAYVVKILAILQVKRILIDNVAHWEGLCPDSIPSLLR